MLPLWLALTALAADDPQRCEDPEASACEEPAPDTAGLSRSETVEEARGVPVADDIEAEIEAEARALARAEREIEAEARAMAVSEEELLRNSVNEAFQPLSRSQYRWLRPSRGRLEPNPYANTDFTAYSLEFGEVKVGLASITVGVLPRTQLGTVPGLLALGVYNGHAKVNLIRFGGLDLAAKGAYHWLPLGDFDGSYLELGLFASQVMHKRFSIHGGASYTSMTARGVPDLTQASPLITSVTGDLSAYNPPPEWFGDDPPKIRAEALTMRAAMDFRINRRDSFVLQGQALLRAAVVTELGDLEVSEVLPPIAGLDEALSYKGNFKVTEAYVASLAYQASWKQVNLRIGVGVSSVPGAWLLQANELSYRFGGKTRRTETRQRKAWRRNKRDVGPPVEAVEPPPLPGEEAEAG